MSKIKVLAVFDIDDRGICSEVIETESNFEGIKKAVSSTLIGVDMLDHLEDFGASFPIEDVIMLQGHDIKDMFPRRGVIYAGYNFPGFVYGFLDGPFVFVRETETGYKTLDDDEIEQIKKFLDCAYSGFYGGDEYMDYSQPEGIENEKMNVQILSKSPDWLNVIYTAGRTCKSHQTPIEIYKAHTPEDKKTRLALALYKAGHLSVFEHCSVSFAVSEVSRSLLCQLSRHRIGVSLSVQSQRYVDYSRETDAPLYVLPKAIEDNPEYKELVVYMLESILGFYNQLIGMGIKPEDARCVLPNAMCTDFVLTVNLRSLLDLYHKRVVVPGAQDEIRRMIQMMADRVAEAEPWTKELFTVGQ